MKLCIKNMVSNRCKMVVSEELKKMGLHFVILGLGEVDIMEDISGELWEQLKTNLSHSGFELMDNKQSDLVQKVKEIILEIIHETHEMTKTDFPTILSERLHYHYPYLAKLFSKVNGVSLQHFIISQKIEWVKEMLLNDELSITEIAYRMNYSSVAHLSNQFKKITGLSPAHFKLLKLKNQVSNYV